MARGTMHAKVLNSANRSGTPHASHMYARTGTVHGPTLEDATLSADWSPFVVKWWDTWRLMPQAVDFEATDWLRLALLAPFYEAVLRKPSAATLSEIRMNEERLGATVVDRMRARMIIEPREDAEATLAAVAPIRRKRADV